MTSLFNNFKLLSHNRNFRLLYAGQFISFIGTMVTSVALPFQVYQLTHSTLMVGALSIVQLLPLLFTALLGGVIADHHNRRLLLFSTEILLSLSCLGLAWNAQQLSPSLTLIFLLASFMSAITGLHRPALESIVQQIVAKNDFPALGSLISLKRSVCMIAGPALGGLIISHYGITTTYVVDCASFLISLLMLLLMSHIPNPDTQNKQSTWLSLREGVSYAFSRQDLIGSYLVDFVAMIFGMPNALFPAIASSLGGVKTLGLLYSAPAVGALIISLFSHWASRIKRHGVAIAVSASLWGVSIIFFGLSQHLYIALICLAFAGAFDALSGIYRSIMWNETIPNHFRGRLAGLEMVSYLSGPRLGDAEAGFVAAAFSISTSIISGGVMCVLGVVACCYFLPKFWHYRSEL